MLYNSNSDDGEYEISNIKRNKSGGFLGGHHTDKQLQEAIQAEKEGCAKLCENIDEPQISIPNIKHIISKTITIRATQKCADLIRKRGE